MSGTPPTLDMKSILSDKSNRVVVCCGAGGVGKTTTAAAMALRAAEYGRNVVVLTIDPAKRLAQALGIKELGNTPQQVPLGPEVAGELHAMMLDMRRTFDEMVLEYSDPVRAQSILDNKFYQTVATSLAGTQEYMAMEKLGQLLAQDRWDLVVVDTPPSRNALDFLEAPDRLTGFFEGRALRMFLAPTGIAAKVVGAGTGVVFSVLKRVTGVDLLSDLSVFFRALGGLIDGFRERAAGVKAILGDPATTFLVVTSPEREPVTEAIYFRGKLRDADMPFGGLVVNRVHVRAAKEEDPDDVRAALVEELGEALAAKVATTLREQQLLAARDEAAVQRLSRETGDEDPVIVPLLDGDVHDVDGLVAIHRHLFASGRERDALLAAAAY